MTQETLASQDSCRQCGGRCCRAFSLRYPPEYFQQVLKNPEEHSEEHAKVAGLLIYLGEFPHNPLFPDSVTRAFPRRFQGTDLHYYSCRNLGLDGRCQDYENRPYMCRDFGTKYHGDLMDCVYFDMESFAAHLRSLMRLPEGYRPPMRWGESREFEASLPPLPEQPALSDLTEECQCSACEVAQ